MRSFSAFSGVAVACAALAFGGSSLAAEGWLTSHADAVAKSKETKKPILADFTGSDWCGWCIKLKKEVFDTKEFQAWAKDNVILLELDFPRKTELPADLKEQNERLRDQYQIKGYPTILFLDAEGKVLGKSGYVEGGPSKWIDSVKSIVKGDVGESGWLTDYEAAVKLAKKEKKMILADFTGSDWCGWCIKLKEEVFDTEEFKAWADANVILLELDFPRNKEQPEELKKQNAELRDKFGIQGYPTILFLDAKGNKKGEMGYEKGGPSVWIEKAAKIAGDKKGKKKTN